MRQGPSDGDGGTQHQGLVVETCHRGSDLWQPPCHVVHLGDDLNIVLASPLPGQPRRGLLAVSLAEGGGRLAGTGAAPAEEREGGEEGPTATIAAAAHRQDDDSTDPHAYFLPGIRLLSPCTPLFDDDVSHAASPPSRRSSSHPNATTRLGELVLCLPATKSMGGVLASLASRGIVTRGGRQAKAMGPVLIATFFFGSIRVLLVAASDEEEEEKILSNEPVDAGGGGATAGKRSASSSSPVAWMMGTDRRNGRTEITGWLPVISDMTALRTAINGHCRNEEREEKEGKEEKEGRSHHRRRLDEPFPLLGRERKARQRGRTIATLARGRLQGLSGTFAFISTVGQEDPPLF